MDANGAEVLRQRILREQQWHWRQAESVREGRANPTDPDAYRLRSCGPGVRVYDTDPPSGRVLVKRLRDGWWRVEIEADPLQGGVGEPERVFEWEPPRLGLNHEPPMG